jgi:hypothetical protein
MRVIAQKLVKAQVASDSRYSVDLKPSINLPSELNTSRNRLVDVEEVQAVNVSFDLDIEARNWGIKSIVIVIQSTHAELDVSLLDTQITPDGKDTENSIVKKIQFDPSQIEIRQTSGSSVTITGLELVLKSDFTVDYEKSYFEAIALIGES